MPNLIDSNQPIYTQDLDAVRAELGAMSISDILPIRHDINAAVFVALGATKKVKALRRRVKETFGEDAAGYIDRLERVGRACARAHALHLTTLHGTDVEEMAGQLSVLRSVFLSEVQALIGSKALPASVIAELIGGTSYKGLTLDVLQLVSTLRHHWASVEALTGVTVSELDRAEALANTFSTAVGENEQGAADSETADLRRRAYSLFIRTYDEVSRQVTFLQWEAGNADEIAPALGSSRARGTMVQTAPAVVSSPTTSTPVTGR